jgi:lysophospholipase L1-like esterase
MAQATVTPAAVTAGPKPAEGSPLRFGLLVLSLLAVLFSRVYIPNIHYDWLNVIPLLASLYIGYALITLEKTCGQFEFVRRSTSPDPGARKPFGSFLFSPWFRSLLLLPVLLLAAEFGLRCVSYHRSLQYERQGDLLFTPIPNQEYTEKISLTHSLVNNLGMRGGPVVLGGGKKIVLCLGDSVTYGYGVDDQHSYPADLQKALDAKYPNQYLVLNGGVDAYPIPFEHQKFLYLWNQGVHPDIVVVGYSFNEGGLGHLVDSDEKTKNTFAAAVRFKNAVRSIALYNLIVENWARASYNRMKKYMVPGTNFKSLSQEDVDVRYQRALQSFADDLTARHVQPVFLLFTGYDGRTNRYDVQGPFQIKFREFAEQNHLPLLVSAAAFPPDQVASGAVQEFFIDQCHMNQHGTEAVAQKLAWFLTEVSDKPAQAGGF